MVSSVRQVLSDAIKDAAHCQQTGDEPSAIERWQLSGVIKKQLQDPTGLEADASKPGFQQVTIAPGGIGGGVSVKPGNMILDLRQLAKTGAEAVLSITGVSVTPWLLPLAVLLLLDKLHGLAEKKISERHASVLWAMTEPPDVPDGYTSSVLLQRVHESMNKYGRPSITEAELDLILEQLLAIRVLDRDQSSNWRVLEKVVVDLNGAAGG